MKTTPIISIVGKKNSGKTTLIEKIIPELKKRNFRVGVIKHSHHRFEMDHEGKDTYRMSRAGADRVAIASPEKVAMIGNAGELSLEYLAEWLFPGIDIIIAEGYKSQQGVRKMEINRKEISKELACRPEEILAVVSNQSFEGMRCFGIDDIAQIADFIVENVSGKNA